MQKDHKLFDDLSKLASGAAGSLLDMRREIETTIAAQVDKMAARMNLVTREEFDAVQAMAEAARRDNEALSERIAALEAASAQAKKSK